MTILEYYEGVARCKRALRDNYALEPVEPRSVDELRHKYYETRCVLKSKGKDRKRKEYRVELREGMTRGAYERELCQLFPRFYALSVVLPELYDSRDYAFTSKSQYRKQVMRVKKEYHLTDKDIKTFMA
jgi:hypothetical protein